MVKCAAALLLVVFLSACGKQKKPEPERTGDPEKGEALFTNTGCAACHSITGESRYGPPLNSILDKVVPVIREGKTDSVRVDRQYILRSLQNPGFEKVASYQKRKMPALNLTRDEINYLVDYIIYINKNQPGSPSGK
jgi:mono/diheme cytochrome c family protein